MKILGIILAVLFLTSSAFVGIVGSNKARKLSHDISELTKGMSPEMKAAMQKEAGDIPSTGRLSGGGVVAIVGGLAALALLVMAFVKKDLVGKAAVAVVALGALSAIIYPHVDTGPMDGMAPRTQAVVATVLAIIGALGAWLAARKATS